MCGVFCKRPRGSMFAIVLRVIGELFFRHLVSTTPLTVLDTQHHRVERIFNQLIFSFGPESFGIATMNMPAHLLSLKSKLL